MDVMLRDKAEELAKEIAVSVRPAIAAMASRPRPCKANRDGWA